MSSAQINAMATPSNPKGTPSRVTRNVLANWGGLAFATVVGFFLAPFVVRHLGNAAYGIWVLTGSLTAYLGVLDLGVRGAVTRYISKFRAQGEHEQASRTASSALLVFSISGAVAICTSLVLTLLIHRFHVPPEYYGAARVVLVLAGLNVAVSLTGGVFGGILVALERQDITNALEVSGSLLRSIAIVIVLLKGYGLVALGMVQLAGALLVGVGYLCFSLRSYPALRVSVRDCTREHLKLIFSFSIYAFLLQVSGYLIYYTDSVVIGAFLPISAITFFAIAGNLMNYMRGLVSGISTAVAPRASALEATQGCSAVQQTLLKGTRYATIVILPIALTLMLRGKSFIALWMGPQYGELSGQVLWILSLAMLFGPSGHVASATLLGIGRHKPLVPAVAAEAICNLVLSIALVKSYGILGVAWGTAIPNLAINLLFEPWYLRRTINVPIWTYFVSTWIRPGTAVVPFAVLTYLVSKLWVAPNLFLFFVQVALVLPAAALGFWFLCFTRGERRQYSTRLVQPLFAAFSRG